MALLHVLALLYLRLDGLPRTRDFVKAKCLPSFGKRWLPPHGDVVDTSSTKSPVKA